MSIRKITVVGSLVCGVLLGAPWAQAAPMEPTPEPAWRELRPNYVKTWYIYNDRNLNGILDPGDQRIDSFRNWWTPVSAHTQANYEIGPYGANSMFYGVDDDKTSAPINFASKVNPDDNYWLPRVKNAVHFYMTYSQFDNNDWSTYTPGALTPNASTIIQDRNLYRNGWALGWVVHDVTKDGSGNFTNDQTQAGNVQMDIYVHNGEGTAPVGGWGVSRSNPQVATSNDISKLALDTSNGPGTQWHPPQYDPAAKDYSWTANALRMSENGLDAGDLATIVGSMELQEKDPVGLGAADVIWGDRTPAKVAATLTDHTGTAAYEYQDAFVNRANYVAGATDGGVIAGLSGYDAYDPTVNNWGDQQVIRIDIAPDTLRTGAPDLFGNITSVVFYDFGQIGSDQLNPRVIVLDLADTSLFPEGRFFIAQVSEIPEPSVLVTVLLGGVALILRRNRCRRPMP